MNATATIIEIRNVTKRFGRQITAVDDVTLDIQAGEFFALLGPSGCGKTTLLRMLAGFETPTAGEVRIDGKDMSGVQPNHRDVNMVFQSYAVFPHMSVFDNVGYGLKVTGTPKVEIAERVEKALSLVQLDGYGNRDPDQLSGGQRQRVALARALVKEPKVLLLDEPLSALDAKLREAMQLELVRLQHAVGITFVIVTHDQDEALSMADRVAVMEAGKVRQIAPPEELYEYPCSRFVADFIGKMNLFEGEVTGNDGGMTEVQVDGLGVVRIPHAGTTGGTTGIAVRPEKVNVRSSRPGDDVIAVEATLENMAYHGSETHLFFETGGGARIAVTLQNDSRSGARFQIGERLWVSWAPSDTLVLKD